MCIRLITGINSLYFLTYPTLVIDQKLLKKLTMLKAFEPMHNKHKATQNDG